MAEAKVNINEDEGRQLRARKTIAYYAQIDPRERGIAEMALEMMDEGGSYIPGIGTLKAENDETVRACNFIRAANLIQQNTGDRSHLIPHWP